MPDFSAIRKKAQNQGLFLPLSDSTDAFDIPAMLHGRALPNRFALQMRNEFDADENGAPTEKTIQRYADAATKYNCSILWLEPTAICKAARKNDRQLVLCKENAAGFAKLCQAVREAAEAAHGTAPVLVALLDHAGQFAIDTAGIEYDPAHPIPADVLSDEALTHLIVDCANAASTAEDAGFEGAALQVCGRNLFGESLAAFNRPGRFGGDFDDRTRFVRDCYTAMKMLTEKLFFTIRLTLSDGVADDGWGMSLTSELPDVSDPTLLLQILHGLYGVELVACEMGLPGRSWLDNAEPESEYVRASRLCACIAMIDSNLQQNVQLMVPELDLGEIPFGNLAAGMIDGEFASYVCYDQPEQG